MSTEPSGPWVEPMLRAKAVDPRNGRPSWNRLAELAKVGTSTITKMVTGGRRTSPATVAKIATALGVTSEEVSEWVSLTRPVRRRYTAPAEADMLTDRQRQALTELIRAFTSDEREDGEEHDERSPSIGDEDGGGGAVVDLPRRPGRPPNPGKAAARKGPKESEDYDVT